MTGPSDLRRILSRIASIGAIFYLIMDIAIHWGILRHLREKVNARMWILITAIVLDAIVLGALIWVKASSDMLVVTASFIGLVIVFAGERLFVRRTVAGQNNR